MSAELEAARICLRRGQETLADMDGPLDLASVVLLGQLAAQIAVAESLDSIASDLATQTFAAGLTAHSTD